MRITGIQLASGVIVTRENAHTSGVGEILDRSENIFQNVCSSERHFLLAKFILNCCHHLFLGRVLVELVTKMQEMTMDKTELGCLRWEEF